jgi:hypothetical protein
MAERPFALVGYYDTPGKLFHACETLRDAGYKRIDAHTPFPVHGLERAMGLPASRLPWIVLFMGMFGGSAGFLLQWWVHAVAYPQNISGKPFFAFQAYVPITFELTVLFAAFGCFFGMWGLNKLPRFFHPVMQHPEFGGASDDRFFLSVEADAEFDAARAKALLEKTGITGLSEVKP